ncbi:hypothetical protein TNCV_4480491 [Trichonephila clavipes]|nr:hypothetical protein TNCV_4480491 [Trichonephila clavipes]
MDRGLQHFRYTGWKISGYSLYCQCVLGGAAVKSNNAPNHDTGSRTSVAMHSTTVQQFLTRVSPNSNPTIVMLQADAGFVSKHNVVPFRCLYPPFIAPLAAQTSVVSSQV